MTDISDRQRQVLEYIRTTVASRGYPPSVREIGDALGLSSPSTVHSHLSSLAKAGLIRKDPSKPRAIEILEAAPMSQTPRDANIRHVPLVGRIAAGSPILAQEDIEDVMALPTTLVGSGPVFMLTVRGDSMIDAGIFDGDYVVVRSQPDALDGEIVAALVDEEEATVKRLFRKNGQIVLQPENEAYEAMVFDGGVRVLGKVVSVLRKVR
ncbi:MAG: transcriptional repressor LexA [Acidimicrobiia bacterium]